MSQRHDSRPQGRYEPGLHLNVGHPSRRVPTSEAFRPRLALFTIRAKGVKGRKRLGGEFPTARLPGRKVMSAGFGVLADPTPPLSQSKVSSFERRLQRANTPSNLAHAGAPEGALRVVIGRKLSLYTADLQALRTYVRYNVVWSLPRIGARARTGR